MLLLVNDTLVVFESNESILNKYSNMEHTLESRDLKSSIMSASSQLVITTNAIFNLSDLSIYKQLRSYCSHSNFHYSLVAHDDLVCCYSNVLLFSIPITDKIINLFILETPVITLILVYSNKIQLYYENELVNSTIIPNIESCSILCTPALLSINQYLYDLHSLIHVYTFHDTPCIISYSNNLYSCNVSKNNLNLKLLSLEYSLIRDNFDICYTDIAKVSIELSGNVLDSIYNGILFYNNKLVFLFNPQSDSAIIEDVDLVSQLMNEHNYSINDVNQFVQYLLKQHLLNPVILILQYYSNNSSFIDSDPINYADILHFILSNTLLNSDSLALFKSLLFKMDYNNVLSIVGQYINNYPFNIQLQILRIVRISFTLDLKLYNMDSSPVISDSRLFDYISLFTSKCAPHPLDHLLLNLELYELFDMAPVPYIDDTLQLMCYVLSRYLVNFKAPEFVNVYNSNHLNVYLDIDVDAIIVYGLNYSDEYLLFIDDLLQLKLLNSTVSELQKWVVPSNDTMLPLERLQHEIDKNMDTVKGVEHIADPEMTRNILEHINMHDQISNTLFYCPLNELLQNITNYTSYELYSLVVQINNNHYDPEYIQFMNILELVVVFDADLVIDHDNMDDLIEALLNHFKETNNTHGINRILQITMESTSANSNIYSIDEYNNAINNGDISRALHVLHYGSYSSEWVESSYVALLHNMGMNKHYLKRFIENKYTSQIISNAQLEQHSFTSEDVLEMMEYKNSALLHWIHSLKPAVDSKHISEVVPSISVIGIHNYSHYMISRCSVWNIHFESEMKYLCRLQDITPFISCMDNKEWGIALYMGYIESLGINMDLISELQQLIEYINNCDKTRKIEIALSKINKIYNQKLFEYYLHELHLQNTKLITNELILEYWFANFKRLKTRLQQSTIYKVIKTMVQSKMKLVHSIAVEELINARYVMGLYLTLDLVKSNNGLLEYMNTMDDNLLRKYIIVSRTQESGLNLNEQDIMTMDKEQLKALLIKRQLMTRVAQLS
eukprot:NODE_5_length_49639_cov_0.484336.p4 type:complete len:1014 gc:universal NODE_5_length_49639_cov_0.484336:14730-17771(+)